MRLKIENLATKQGFGYREVAKGAILQSLASGSIYLYLSMIDYKFFQVLRIVETDKIVKGKGKKICKLNTKSMYRLLQAS